MKLSLGKVFLLLCIFYISLFSSSEYKWSGSINKRTALVNEAIYLKYTCEFNDNGELYTINFNPLKKYEKYDIFLLKENENIINKKRVNTYEFIVFAKKVSHIDFDFDLVMKKTTIDSINDLSGGLDNDKANEGFTNKFLKQQLISIDIKKSTTELVGNFSLKIKKDKENVQAFMPYHLEVFLKGEGNFQNIEAIKFDIKDVKIFSQKPVKKTILTKNGYSGVWSQKFAFVSEKDFTIPAFEIKYFDLKSKQIVELKNKSIDIRITKGYVKEKLLDKKEEKFEFSFTYIYYFLSFLLGFLLSKIKFKKDRVKDKKTIIFEDKVKKVKSLEELHIMLVLQNTYKYQDLIAKIENKEVSSLSKAKKIIYEN